MKCNRTLTLKLKNLSKMICSMRVVFELKFTGLIQNWWWHCIFSRYPIRRSTGKNKHILKTQIIKVQRRISLFYLWSATEVKLQSRISQKWSFRGMCVVFELKFTGISYSYSKWMMTHFFFTQIRKSTRKNTILKCK